MKKSKLITLKLDMLFETDGECITWVGSSGGLYDAKGKSLNSINYPSTHNLLLHYLGKCIQGKNGEDELAIVNEL